MSITISIHLLFHILLIVVVNERKIRMGLKEINIEEMNLNPFTLIGKEWMLITAGNEEKFNTMTASWGGLGVYGGKNVVEILVRPQRYTKEFVDTNETFTLSFFEDTYKKALALCGKVSGRDVNKIEKTGLTPAFTDGTTYFEEAKLVFVCKKVYHSDMKNGTFDNTEYDESFYPEKDYHNVYIGEILKVLEKQ